MESLEYMNGKISQWKDDKGFGFITSDDGQKVFFHISSLTTKSRRPEVGDCVVFTSKTDAQNRLKATSVAIEGLAKTPKYQNSNNVEPKTKNAFDYFLIIILLFSIAAVAKSYLDSNNLEQSAIFGIPAVIAFILLGRQKKPKNSAFNCSKCQKSERYDSRTISAWNSGFTRLYCNPCHVQWLRNNPRQQETYSSKKGGGCLGTVTLMLGTALFGGYTVIDWLVQTVI
ncbi:cold shock domain-containing protein [Psychromonas sp.]|uniref:cold shock domain-containing protein n=1 Tax=Psychromonas sp. TaxID=1884585 RepID=UPI003565C1D2